MSAGDVSRCVRLPACLDPALVLGSGVAHLLAHVLRPVHAPGQQRAQRLPVQRLVAEVAQQAAVQAGRQRLAAPVAQQACSDVMQC